MQLATRGPDDLRQPSLVGGVDVLVARLDFERPVRPLGTALLQPIVDRHAFTRRENADRFEGLGIHLASVDVMPPHTFVDVDGRVELLHQWVDCFGEAAAPQLRSTVAVTGRC